MTEQATQDGTANKNRKNKIAAPPPMTQCQAHRRQKTEFREVLLCLDDK